MTNESASADTPIEGTQNDRVGHRSYLPRRRFVNDMPDKGLFVIAAMAGFASIFTLKISGVDAHYIAVGAVVAMLAYGAIAYRMPAVQLRVDRLGDNFYYLGFIYTLASLSAALVQIRTEELDDLIGSFGIALFTTIVGVAGRVMFAQMRGELDEVEAEIRRDLLHTSAELRGQIALTLREFKTLHTVMTQTSGEIFEQSVKGTERQVLEIVKVADAAKESIEKGSQASAAQIRRVDEILNRMASAADTLAQKTAAMELPSARLEEQVAKLTEQTDALLRRLQKAFQETKRRRRWLRRWW